VKPADIEETLQQMTTAEDVEEVAVATGKRGRPTKRYRLITE
jgi:predicted ArsR family transcriptional regulator